MTGAADKNVILCKCAYDHKQCECQDGSKPPLNSILHMNITNLDRYDRSANRNSLPSDVRSTSDLKVDLFGCSTARLATIYDALYKSIIIIIIIQLVITGNLNCKKMEKVLWPWL